MKWKSDSIVEKLNAKFSKNQAGIESKLYYIQVETYNVHKYHFHEILPKIKNHMTGWTGFSQSFMIS